MAYLLQFKILNYQNCIIFASNIKKIITVKVLQSHAPTFVEQLKSRFFEVYEITLKNQKAVESKIKEFLGR